MKSGAAFIFLALGISIAIAIGGQTEGSSPTLDEAARLVGNKKLKEAVTAIEGALATGGEKPSRVISDPAFRPLLTDHQRRAEVHRILAKNVRESEVAMVFPDEPGEKLHVEGKVVSQKDGAPKAGVIVFVYQTDAKGIYAIIGGEDVGSVNPRLFAFAKTDAAGKFTFHTIMPASYPDTTEPRHIHWMIDEARPQGAFLFDDDPVLTPASRIKEAKYLEKVRVVKGVKVIEPVIKL